MNPRSRLSRLILVVLLISSAVAPVRGATQSEAGHKVAVSPPPRAVVMHLHPGYATESFALTSDTGIRLGANPNAFLTDLRAGETARIDYTVENGFWVAHEIVVNPPAGAHVAAHATTGSQPAYLHAHGTILSYNVNTGVLTIRHNR